MITLQIIWVQFMYAHLVTDDLKMFQYTNISV